MSDEVLKDLRENVRTFIKLDLTYIVAAGAAVTAFQLTADDALRITGYFWFFAAMFGLILLYDASLDAILLREWIAAKAHRRDRLDARIVSQLVLVQPIRHALFICMIVFMGLKVAIARYDFQRQLELRSIIQSKVEIFIGVEKRVPKSIDELRAAIPTVSDDLERLGNEPIALREIGKKRSAAEIEEIRGIDYIIDFAGPDKKFGTGDDLMVTRDYSIGRLLKDIKRERNEKPSKAD